MNSSWFQEKNNSIAINVYVVTGACRTEITGIYNNSLKIKLNAKPQDNEANKELVYFLSKSLKLPKSNIEIIIGQKQRNKVLSLTNCDVKKLLGLLK